MQKNDKSKLTKLSQAGTVEDIAEFWDSHSLADYWDQTEEVQFEVTAKRKHRIGLDPTLYAKLAAEADARGLPPDILATRWLTERLRQENAI